jgi:hypothetical protein
VVLVMLIVQPFIIDLSASNKGLAIMRSVLFIAAAALVFFDWQFVWPKIQKYRSEYLDHADEPEIANPARDRFDQEQRKSLSLLGMVGAVLLGIILFSSSITPPLGQTFQMMPATGK